LSRFAAITCLGCDRVLCGIDGQISVRRAMPHNFRRRARRSPGVDHVSRTASSGGGACERCIPFCKRSARFQHLQRPACRAVRASRLSTVRRGVATTGMLSAGASVMSMPRRSALIIADPMMIPSRRFIPFDWQAVCIELPTNRPDRQLCPDGRLF
jgi:hypothetical protein